MPFLRTPLFSPLVSPLISPRASLNRPLLLPLAVVTSLTLSHSAAGQSFFGDEPGVEDTTAQPVDVEAMPEVSDEMEPMEDQDTVPGDVTEEDPFAIDPDPAPDVMPEGPPEPAVTVPVPVEVEVPLPTEVQVVVPEEVPVTTEMVQPDGGNMVEEAQSTDELLALYENYIHFALIYRPELASDYAQKLLDSVKGPDQLVAVVESSRDYGNPYDDRVRRILTGNETMREVSQRFFDMLGEGRQGRAEEQARIANNIERLGRGPQAFELAVTELKAAGQYAAPAMLEALSDEDRSSQHANLVRAMVDIGRPMVDPLSVALPHLDPTVQARVARVLAEIGYPEALPYLKLVADAGDTSPGAKIAAQRAFERIATRANVPRDASAADLFTAVAESQYTAGTQDRDLPTYDEQRNVGIVWSSLPSGLLVVRPVPGEVYHDSMAMRSASEALLLDPDRTRALTLWLAANLRRENNLPQGATDPTYPPRMRPASYYLLGAGPDQQNLVLARALRDRDAGVALDAIAALRDTAGMRQLLAEPRQAEPLLRAMNFPDARVRHDAAAALAAAMPRTEYDGAFRVVPTLADSVRQTGTRYALVIAPEAQRNELVNLLAGAGFEAFGAATLGEGLQAAQQRPGVDLLVVQGPLPEVTRTIRDARAGGTGGGAGGGLPDTPAVGVVERLDQPVFQQRFRDVRDVSSVVVEEVSAALPEAATTAARARGTPEPGEATQMALEALRLLREVARTPSVYQAAEAQPALVQALSDARAPVAAGAGEVLAQLENEAAQEALAESALSQTGELQVALLNSLAQSATLHGNLLGDRVYAQLLELMAGSQGSTAVAAARAAGALRPPTSFTVEAINAGESQPTQ